MGSQATHEYKITVQKDNVSEDERETSQGLLWKIDRFAIHDGPDNSIILRNLRVSSEIAKENGKTMVIRQVVVPTLNDEENIIAPLDLLAGLPHLDMVELLPYHSYGLHEYKALGRRYAAENLEPPSASQMQSYKNYFEDHGIQCDVGGS